MTGTDHAEPSSGVGLSAPLIAQIDSATRKYGTGRPIPKDEARQRFSAAQIIPDEDYLEFISRWGGCYMGASIHAWDQHSLLGTSTCLELTTQARDNFGDVINGVVFADDGSGNPMWVTAGGPVQLIDHNNGFDVIRLSDSFCGFLETYVDD